jgi:hypothetical protein
MGALFWTIFQYYATYTINLDFTIISINWLCVVASFMLKFIGLLSGAIFVLKYKVIFIFFKGDDVYLFIITAISVFIGTSGIFIGEMALTLSVNDTNNIVSNSSLSASYLLLITIVVERFVNFLVYNLYCIPSLTSWSHTQKMEIKTKDYEDQIIVKDKEAKRLAAESNIVFKVLNEMLPRNIAHQLIAGGTVMPKKYQSIVVFFSDIKGFTSFADGTGSKNVFRSLDRLYTVMDDVLKQFPALYKVETAGDAFMVYLHYYLLLL